MQLTQQWETKWDLNGFIGIWSYTVGTGCHKSKVLIGCYRIVSQGLFALVNSPGYCPWPSVLDIYSLILVMSQNSSKFRRWNYADNVIRLKKHHYLVQDVRKSRAALSEIFLDFTGWTVLWMHQGNGVILQSLRDWFGVGGVYSSTTLEEGGASSGRLMQKKMQRGNEYYLC